MQTLSGSREEILLKFYNEFIVPLFARNGYILPSNVRVSIGLLPGKNAIGTTFHPTVGQGFFHIYIAPQIAKNVYEVFATLIHEAIHTLFFDHLKGFSTCAKAVGLVKPWTATTASNELDIELTQWLADMDISWREPWLNWSPGGKTGGGSIVPAPFGGYGGIGSPKKQPTRMIKLSCPDCNYIVRTAKSNVITKGLPVCPCGTQFVEN